MAELKLTNTGNELKLFNMDQASSLLGIRKSTLYDFCMRKQITFVKIGKLNRFRSSDIQDFINNRIVEKAN
ncbi:MAG: Helix-turn-helix domain protein [Candidatus Brocadia sinica]|nr:MAG: Helix-turn-helix domain protein [Candidatus Brocadia sinica]